MPEYKTPGVYIEEISTLPASIAPVATAIPAFVGYTKFRKSNDEDFPINTPKRIRSMLEFKQMFGSAFDEFFEVTIEDPIAGEVDPVISADYRATAGNPSPYVLYHQVKMFYDNGGGPCYIVSVGDFVTAATSPLTDPADLPTSSDIDKDELINGLNACEEVDEITLLCVPESVFCSEGNRKEIYDAMLAQSANLQDRFALMDVLTDATSSVFDSGNRFRSKDVSSDNLKYGAAYYPQMKTLYDYPYISERVLIDDTRSFPIYDDQRLSTVESGKALDGSDYRTAAVLKIKVENHANFSGDSITINGVTLTHGAEITDPFLNNSELADKIRAAINASSLSADFTASIVGPATTTVVVTANDTGAEGNGYEASYNDSGTGAALSLQGQTMATGETILTTHFSGGSDGIDLQLFNNIISELEKFKIDLYPCGAMAGIYATIDRTRGVWRAPANYSVNRIKGTTVLVTKEEQEDLNVDATSGKSINAIRHFTGKGNLVWGARTLAGNDNEWRYVPVRRFFNFAEESIKKATEFVVFEPNDRKTWVRVKGMIENFLVKQWRDGALAGAKPEDAFFVKVGLGETMTSLDILEGRMNVEVGMAVVRPAEFIILKFSHKLQVS